MPRTNLSLAKYAAELEAVCSEIDDTDEITEDLIRRFDDAKLALGDKVDRWICYLDSAKFLVAALKEKKERLTKALKVTETLQSRLKDYAKYVIESVPERKHLTGSNEGTLYLHKNPEGIKYSFDFKDVTFYRTVEKALIEMEPSLNSYVKVASCYLVDTDKIKADLKAGMKLPWAQLHQDSHVRIKG